MTKWTLVLRTRFFDDFLLIFNMCTCFLALKSKETVLWPNGHQFWEVDFWWLFGHFHHVYVFFGSKIERNGRMTKRTLVLRSQFWITFWWIYILSAFFALKSEDIVIWSNEYECWISDWCLNWSILQVKTSAFCNSSAQSQ